jgi:hypothetical protein
LQNKKNWKKSFPAQRKKKPCNGHRVVSIMNFFLKHEKNHFDCEEKIHKNPPPPRMWPPFLFFFVMERSSSL